MPYKRACLISGCALVKLVFLPKLGFAMTAIENRGVSYNMTQFGCAYLVIGLFNIFIYLSTYAVEMDPVVDLVGESLWIFSRVLRYK